jgi:predicted RNA-binding protein (TIGR00451 family)
MVIVLISPSAPQLRKIVGIASYQFGNDAGMTLFARGIRVALSRRTGRMRHIFKNGKLIATMRPKDGYIALTSEGALLFLSAMKNPSNLVVVQNDVADFIKAGGDVFAKHVIRADESLRPAEEVVVTNEEGKLLGVGKAVLSGNDMKHFKRGVAVKVRSGTDHSAENNQ